MIGEKGFSPFSIILKIEPFVQPRALLCPYTGPVRLICAVNPLGRLSVVFMLRITGHVR